MSLRHYFYNISKCAILSRPVNVTQPPRASFFFKRPLLLYEYTPPLFFFACPDAGLTLFLHLEEKKKERKRNLREKEERVRKKQVEK